MVQVFKAKLTPRGPGGAWTFLTIPFDVATVFGSKARVPLAGTINGFPFRKPRRPRNCDDQEPPAREVAQAARPQSFH
jgi:hypothetical protein